MVKSHPKQKSKKYSLGMISVSILITLVMVFLILAGVFLIQNDNTVSATIINRDLVDKHMIFTVEYEVNGQKIQKNLRYYEDLPGNVVQLYYRDDPYDPNLFSMTNVPLGISFISIGTFLICLTWIIFYFKQIKKK